MPNIDPELWVIVHGGPESAASHANVPEEVQQHLVSQVSDADTGREILFGLLQNPRLLLATYIALQDAGYAGSLLKACPDLPGAVVAELFDRDTELAEIAAGHPSTPEATQIRLAKGGDGGVRYALAKRAGITEPVVEALVQRIDNSEDPGSFANRQVLHALAGNTDVDHDGLSING